MGRRNVPYKTVYGFNIIVEFFRREIERLYPSPIFRFQLLLLYCQNRLRKWDRGVIENGIAMSHTVKFYPWASAANIRHFKVV